MKFLKVDKKYLNSSLKPLEILILSQIEEFISNGRECYITNKQFSEMFNVTQPTVDAALERLEQLNYITRLTQTISGKGKITKVRKIVLVNYTPKTFEWSY